MNLRTRQLVGYLAAGVAILALVAGFFGGYTAGYWTVTSGERTAPPRRLPDDVCALMAHSTRVRLVPSAGKPALTVTEDDVERTSTCQLETSRRRAVTYNGAKLTIRVTRFGVAGERTGADAAERAMRKARKAAGLSGRKVADLGDRSWVTVDQDSKHHWSAQLRVQRGDTLVAVDYVTWLADGTDTEAAAVATAREVLAGLS